MLILSRLPWTASSDASALTSSLDTLLSNTDPVTSSLILLPPGDEIATPTTVEDVKRNLRAVASELNIFLAASLPVEEYGVVHQLGIVIAPNGERLVICKKTLPDLGTGFSNQATQLYKSRTFEVGKTPLGKISMLLGEDVLSPHLVRACAFAGAEIILNPTRERSDSSVETKRTVRAARAYENIMYVASTSAMFASGSALQLANTTAVFDFNGKEFLNADGAAASYADIDIGELRRRRQEPFANFLAVNRTSLYARDYKRATKVNSPAPATRAEWQAEGERRVKAKPHVSGDAPTYDVVAIQTLLRNVPDVAHRDEVIQLNLSDSLEIASKWAIRPNVKLTVFPEFWMQGVHFQRSLEDWTKVAITIPGPEIDQLRKFAQSYNSYVAGAAFEFDPDWPDRWFNTAFIIDDSGDLIHRYRKIQCGDTSGMMNNSTPGNLLSAYLDKYGYDYLFPVANTPLGRLATIICFDVNFPETTRAMVRRGAEVIIHPTAEPHNTRRQGWDKARRARAFENTAYIISVAIGGEYRNHDDIKPEFFHRGFSKIIKYDGTIDAIADGPGEVPLVSRIDLGALRRARTNPAINLELWDEPHVYADAYGMHAGFPEDVWLETPMQVAHEGLEQTEQVIERYTETGIFESA